MNQRRLTTLISKVTHFSILPQISDLLRAKGLKLSVKDISQIAHDYLPNKTHSFIDFGLDFLRPFAGGMGLRIVNLTEHQIELLLPARRRNCNELGAIHQGALMTAGIEASRILFNRNWSNGEIKMHSFESQIHLYRDIYEDCHVKMALTPSHIESLLGELRMTNQARLQSNLLFSDKKGQLVGEMNLKVQMEYIPAIEYK